MGVRLLTGDSLDMLATLEPASIGACCTDPPYELSKDGKASPNRVFLEMMFPNQPKVAPESTGDVHLPRLVRQILRLREGGSVPRPAPAMPVGAVALDSDMSGRQVDVEHSGERAIGATDGQGRNNRNAEPTEHFGDFTLELTDPAALLNALDRVGCSFLASGLGIGLRIGPSTLPSLLAERGVVDLCDENVRTRYDASADLVRAFVGAASIPVLRLELGRTSLETLTTDGALVLCAVLLAGRAKLIRTEAATGRLPTKLESRRIRIVDPTTHRAISLNLVLHPQIIASEGFMGKGWDGSKAAYDVAIWREVYRVLKPGAWLLAFGGTRTYHRLTCAIEDAGFEIRDTLMWLYGSGFPKGKACLKPGWEPIVLARKKGPLWLNVDGCRLEGVKEIPGGKPRRAQQGVAYGELGNDPGTGSGWNPNVGRWPANVVLSHEPECREVGTKQVKTSINAKFQPIKTSRGHTGGSFGNETARKPDGHERSQRLSPQYADADGTETVAAWECVESCAVRMLDAQSGVIPPSYRKSRTTDPVGSTWALNRTDGQPFGHHDTGGASRFYYCAKASTAERGQGNDWPTVKPLALMDWLVRLVTPPGETGIDPFCGSGSTLLAWDRLGFDCIGIDADPHAIEIAHGRLTRDAGVFADVAAS